MNPDVEMRITVNGENGKLHLSLSDKGLFIEDCKDFGTEACEDCKYKFKCYTERRLAGKMQIGMPLKSLFEMIVKSESKHAAEQQSQESYGEGGETSQERGSQAEKKTCQEEDCQGK